MNFSNEKVNAVFAENSYSDFSHLMYDTGMGKSKVEKDKADAKIREIFHQVLGTNKDSSRKDIRKAIRKNHIELCEIQEEVLENLVSTGFQDNPFFKEFVEYRSANDGDTNEFYVENDVILTVAKLAGNHHDLIRQRLGRGQSFSVQTSWYGLKIYTEFELFMTGRVDWANYINKVYEAFDKKMNAMLYSAVMEGTKAVTPTAQFIKTGALSAVTKDTLLELIEDVQAANSGADVVIMGTRSALAKLPTETDWISDGMKEERHTTGRLGIWEGTRLVEIPQAFADGDTTTKLVDNNVLLVMPVTDNKFIKFFNEGDAQVRQISDGDTNMDKTIEYEYQMKVGFATVINRKFGRWNITV